MLKPVMFVFLFAPLLLLAQVPESSYLQDRILVQLNSECHSLLTLPTEMYASASEFGLKSLDRVFTELGGSAILRAHRPVKDKKWEQSTGFNRWFIVQFSKDLDVFRAVARFAALPEVEHAEIITQGEFTLIPNDPYFPNNWGHNNTQQLPGYAPGGHTGPVVGVIGFDTKATLAWNNTQGLGSASVIIAILDSGVDTSHPDLRLVPGYDTYDNDDNVNPSGVGYAHGTACAGIAAARGNNNLGVIGIAGGCSIMPLKISGATMFSSVVVINAITWATDHGAHIISMSFTFGSLHYGDSPALDNAINYAYNNGLTLFAATGNNNSSSILYPASHPNVISVGAASPSGERKSPSSSDGEQWGSNYGSTNQEAHDAVDVMGPTILPTTDITGETGYSETDYAMFFSGTSCATPYVAGVAALIKSKYPTYTPLQIERLLQFTCTDMTIDGGIGWDRFTGFGMVNANAALSWSGSFPQTCNISYPANGAVIVSGTTQQVRVNVLDITNTARVEFFLGASSTPSHTDFTSPYTWNWNTAGLSYGTYTLRAVAYPTSGSSAQSQIQVAVILATMSVWTGTSSTSWTTTENWLGGQTPNATRDVLIPAYTPFSPTINATSQQCRDFEILPGAAISFSIYSLTVNSNAIIGGNLTMSTNGYLRVLDSLTFKAGATSNLGSASSEIRAEGDLTFEANSDFQMSNGRFVLQGSYSANLVSHSPSMLLYNFTVNKSSATVYISTPGAGNINCQSTVNLSSGTLMANDACNLVLRNNLSGSGLIKMNSGTLWSAGSGVNVSLAAESYLNNVGLLGDASLSFLSNALIKGNVEFGEGFISAENRVLTIGGSWISDSSSQFNRYGSQVVFNGTGDQSIGSTQFNILTINKSSGTVLILAGKQATCTTVSTSQTAGNLRIDGSLTVSQQCDLTIASLLLYGSLSLNSGTMTMTNTLTSGPNSSLSIATASFILNASYTGALPAIAGTLVMNGGLIESTHNGILFGIASQTTINGGTIRVGWSFSAPYPNTFQASNGTVEFTGGRFADVNLGAGNYFAKLLINKPSTSYQVYCSTNIALLSDLTVQGGELALNQYLLSVGRDVIINGGRLNAGNASAIVEVGRNWTNNAASTNFSEGSGTVKFKLSDISTLSSETFNLVQINRTGPTNVYLQVLSNNTVVISGGLSILIGRLSLSSGSILKLNNSCPLNIGNGGELFALGSNANNAMITSDSGYYSFTCNNGSRLAADYCIFERMNANGVFLAADSIVDSSYPLTNCTFRNGVSGGTLIKKFSTQALVVFYAVFPANTWSGTYNVYHSSVAGSITFNSSSGAFTGAAYENDPANHIHWVYPNPLAAHTPIPTNNANAVSVNTQLGWTYSTAPDYPLPLGFRVRMHADEFHDTGGASIAVDLGAMSADHLLSVSDHNILRLASSRTVATLLPGTALFLNKPFPPGRKLLDAGAAVSLASDFNPGSCYCESMPFMVTLAVCACGFSVEEALVAATANGAAALGLPDRKGSLVPGHDSDFIVWNLDDYRRIPYHMAVPDIGAVNCGSALHNTGESFL